MALDSGTLLNSVEGAEQGTEEAEDEYYSDDSSDSEQSSDDFAAVPRAFEQVIPRSLKRTYGVLADDVLPQRRLKSKLDEQLEFLREIIPSNQRDERASVLLDAYQYIRKLQQRVDDLHTELVTEHPPANAGEIPPVSQTNLPPTCTSCQQPMVEVTRTEGKLEVRIVCVNRPGLLVDIMGALDSSRLNVLHASIACYQDLIFETLSLEGCFDITGSRKILVFRDSPCKLIIEVLVQISAQNEEDIVADSEINLLPKEDSQEGQEEGLKADLVRAICQSRFNGGLQ